MMRPQIALKELGLDMDELRGEEYDMGLGNGGLGRLAACFLDSLATLDYPAVGYGIHYEFGLFRQEFSNGHQIELPDDWMRFGTPWEIVRPEYTQTVELYGHVENVFDDKGNYVPRWTNTTKIVGVPYDIPIPGYGTNTVNFLRLWESRPSEKINLEAFNRGGYSEALAAKTQSETVSKVLYPNDKTESGQGTAPDPAVLLRLVFAARHHPPLPAGRTPPWPISPTKVAMQLNDTHPCGGRGGTPAHSARRERDALGRSLGHRHQDLRLHQPHAAAGSAGEVERAALPESAAASPANDLRDQQAPARRRSRPDIRATRTRSRSCRSSRKAACR